MSLFPFFFCTIAVFFLYGEYVVRFPPPDGVFLPCDHGLVFLHQLMREFNQTNLQSSINSTSSTVSMLRQFDQWVPAYKTKVPRQDLEIL